MEVGAGPLADLETVRNVPEAIAGDRLVVLHVVVDPIVERTGTRHDGLLARRLPTGDGSNFIVHENERRAGEVLRERDGIDVGRGSVAGSGGRRSFPPNQAD